MKFLIFRYSLYLILLLTGYKLQGQNLVINPSFEDHNPCPLDTCITIIASKNWIDAGIGYTGYFTDCSPNMWRPPYIDYHDYQWPRTGKCMIMVTTWFDSTPIYSFNSEHLYRQFPMGYLSKVLIKDSLYHAGCFVNLKRLAIDNFGLAISDSLIKYHPSLIDSLNRTGLNIFNPQIQNPVGHILDDTMGWMPVEGIFKATGGEKYIYIGSFRDDKNTNSPENIYSWGDAQYFIDDVFVEPINFPTLHPNHDTTICPGTSLILRTYAGHSFAPRWQDGSTLDSFKVTKPGIYWVEFDSLGYKVRDSIRVGYYDMRSGLAKEQVVCSFPYTITAPVTSSFTYNWPDSSSGFQYTVPKEGPVEYILKSDFCIAHDSINIISKDHFRFKLPNDTFLCKNDTFKEDLSGIGNDISWQDGSSEKVYPITSAGNYAVTLHTGCGDIEKRFHLTLEDCRCTVWVPNAFTPDDDSTNDQFRCIPSCATINFELNIYNRYGLRLFHSTDPLTGWDGLFRNDYCPEGVYLYYLKYTMPGEGEQVKHGMLHLVR
jgi:gliding motility-associated-like protein